MSNLTRASAIGILWGLLVACQGADTSASGAGNEVTESSADLVWQALQCGRSAAGVRWINDRSELENVVKQANRGQLGGSEPEVPDVDFSRNRLILVDLGQKATPGYSIGLASSSLKRREGHHVTLRLRIGRPAEDSVQPQVVTSPCGLVTLGHGNYEKVSVVDAEGALLGELVAD